MQDRGSNTPESERVIEPSFHHCLAKGRAEVEVVSVRVKVRNEVVSGQVGWEVVRAWEEGELAELLREVKPKPIVRSDPPERPKAVGSV